MVSKKQEWLWMLDSSDVMLTGDNVEERIQIRKCQMHKLGTQLFHRQIHAKHRPYPKRAFDFDVPLMAFYYFFDNGEAKSGAVF